MEDRSIGRVLVMGAGVAGIRAALELAENGYQVLLTDSSAHIGGILTKLDFQFPSDHCGMCKMLPTVGREYASQYCMRKHLFHDNIEIMPFTKVRAVRGEPGSFTVELLRGAHYVDTDICMGTGYCTDVCPVEVPDEFNEGLTSRKAIYRPVPHNLPNMFVIDADACTRCGECVKVCPVDAIDLDAKDESQEVVVDAVVLAAGTELCAPENLEEMSAYRASQDVVTALQFERLLSSSGCFAGEIRRPSDGGRVRRIGWLQCVGSRDRRHGRDYCSSICCMFALKQAVMAHKKGGPDVETTIFYMDMRTFEKDFYRYREYAEEEHGVRLVRCRVQGVDRMADGTLSIRYFDSKTGEFELGEFDLVVLSTGQAPLKVGEALEKLLGLEFEGSAYCPALTADKVRSPVEGVYMCGSFLGLSDISGAITSGIAAAGRASALMHSLRREFKRSELPVEKPVARQLPRTAVILCGWKQGKCPSEIDLEPLRTALLEQSGVGEVHILDTLCQGESYEKAEAILAKSSCNRVIFCACLPYVYRHRLRLLAERAGFNPTLVQVVDLRGLIQRCLAEKDEANFTRRALAELQGTLDELKVTDALPARIIPVEQRALVVGGGIAGMRAALSLAERGIEVDLVERSPKLGGHSAKGLHTTLEGYDPAAVITELTERTHENRKVNVYLNSEVVASNGSLGCFRTAVRNGGEREEVIRHGATILATGGREATTEEYCFGQSDRIVTQSELEQRLANGAITDGALDTIVMIQCVGSRERGAHEYCSRVCCAAALKNALETLRRKPDARVIILNRDIMTYGFLERYYTEARAKGVIFAKYDLEAKPEVEVVDGAPVVRFTDSVLRTPVEVNPNLLVLSTGIEPSDANPKLAEIFGVELSADGFFQEAESKWRPVDLLKAGLFVAGVAHSPRPINEVIVQAEAAAQRAFTYLSQQILTAARRIARVRDSLCSRCQVCIAVCPYEAREFDAIENRIVIDPAACQGCGMCSAACPNGAAEVVGLTENQTMAAIDAALCEL
jgi:heterodisulfide reductase subunit A